MTWLSHTTIATALVLPFAPHAIPIVVAGSTAPDWLEWVLKPFFPYIKHRNETHYLALWIILFILSFAIDFNSLLFWFSLGGITHVLADSLTVSGVPLSPFDRTRFHLFGGAIKESGFYKFRTGSMSEYIIAFSLLAFAIVLNNPIHALVNFGSNKVLHVDQVEPFNPYIVNYREMFQKKVIDELEYKTNRFSFF